MTNVINLHRAKAVPVKFNDKPNTVSMVESCQKVIDKLDPRVSYEIGANDLSHIAELFNSNKWIMMINRIDYSNDFSKIIRIEMLVNNEQLMALTGC